MIDNMEREIDSSQTITIHPTAIVSNKAILHPGVEVGPYSIVGDLVELKAGVKLKSHVYLEGDTVIGEGTLIYPFAVIGTPPQDLKYQGEESKIVVGKNNTIREHVTIHGGTSLGRTTTTIGDNCLIMVGSHIAHDCLVGNHIIMANNATLGGHVILEDYVIIGGLSAIHQLVRIGKHAIIGAGTIVAADVIPYGSAAGERAKLLGLNTRGMKRHSFNKTEILSLHEAFEKIFRSKEGTFNSRLVEVELDYKNDKRVLDIVTFLKNNKVRPICIA
jgi:UDP-N-acetylglucosamine acyltransferase